MSEMESVSGGKGDDWKFDPESAVPASFTPTLASDPEFQNRAFGSAADAWKCIKESVIKTLGDIREGEPHPAGPNNRYPALCVDGKFRIVEPRLPELNEGEGRTESFSFWPAVDGEGKECLVACDDHGNPMGPVELKPGFVHPKPFNHNLSVDLAATGILDRLSKFRDLFSQVGVSDIPKLMSILKSIDLSKFGDLLAAYEAFASITSPIDTAAGVSDRTKAALVLLGVWSSMTATTIDDELTAKLGVIVGNEILLNTVAAIVAAVIQKMEAHAVTVAEPEFRDICSYCVANHRRQTLPAESQEAVKEHSRAFAASFDFASISAIVQAVVSLIGLIRGLRKTPATTAASELANNDFPVNEFGNAVAGNFGGHSREMTADEVGELSS